MKKMNGVTMDGSTVIDIDCNLSEIVIPEYAVTQLIKCRCMESNV